MNGDSFASWVAASPLEMFGEPDEPCEGCGDDGSSGFDGWRWGDDGYREPCPICNPQGRHNICGRCLPNTEPFNCDGCYELPRAAPTEGEKDG